MSQEFCLNLKKKNQQKNKVQNKLSHINNLSLLCPNAERS